MEKIKILILVKNIVFIVLLLCLLPSCVAPPVSGGGFISSGFPIEHFSSYTQWNENYAVTVSHYKPYLEEQKKSTTLDLKFFKKSTFSNQRKWSEPKDNELVSMTGYVDNGQEYKRITGRVLPYHLSNYKGYRLIDAVVKPGMSGGPILNQSGQIIGINVGYSAQKLKVGSTEGFFTLFISYEEIKKEWMKINS